jgi:hypothetical protein
VFVVPVFVVPVFVVPVFVVPVIIMVIVVPVIMIIVVAVIMTVVVARRSIGELLGPLAQRMSRNKVVRDRDLLERGEPALVIAIAVTRLS